MITLQERLAEGKRMLAKLAVESGQTALDESTTLDSMSRPLYAFLGLQEEVEVDAEERSPNLSKHDVRMMTTTLGLVKSARAQLK